jgi:hypothetical protein
MSWTGLIVDFYTLKKGKIVNNGANRSTVKSTRIVVLAYSARSVTAF